MTNGNQDNNVAPRGQGQAPAPAERMLDQIGQAIEKERLQKLKQSLTPLIKKDLELKQKIKDVEKAQRAAKLKLEEEIQQNILAITEFLADEELAPEVLQRVLS